ncbi:unnamed protein product [marine sediment metagenome]|uniref:Uncharacterized protein n=1 Tax=marine sediment metagenome TaxID=412755 RepID=X1PTX8_9ZZZZ
MAKCSLCHREGSEGGYCGYHRDAHANLVAAYEAWRKSTELSWTGFLEEVIQTKEIGGWAREVALDFLSK